MSNKIWGIYPTWASVPRDSIACRMRARQQSGDQLADQTVNEHRVKPGPHKHYLTNQLKNNVCEASSANHKNYKMELNSN
jgi:hypothetical protein